MSEDNHHTVITASWNASEGIHSSFRICLNEVSACISCSQCENFSQCRNCTELGNCSYTKATQFIFQDKTPGMEYFLCVAALTDSDRLSGERAEIRAYTRKYMGFGLVLIHCLTCIALY